MGAVIIQYPLSPVTRPLIKSQSLDDSDLFEELRQLFWEAIRMERTKDLRLLSVLKEAHTLVV